MKLSKIGMLWMEGPLSYLEQLCVKSFVDAGHEVILYHYGKVTNVPEGVKMETAEQFLPREDFLVHRRTGSPALHSDVFRYKMLKNSENTIWADTDAYCLRPFETANGHFYGWESKSHINGGVLGLPHDSATLDALLEFTSDEFAIPSYYGPEYEQELIDAKANGNPVHASEQPWGVWGPHAITHFLHETGEVKYAKPVEELYPVSFKDRALMLKRNRDLIDLVTENTKSIHFYGRRMRKRLVEKENGFPHHKSLIGQLLKKHNIDPRLAPLPEPGHLATARKAKEDGQLCNLTDLADMAGSDNGSNRHRFTEIYHMLLQARQDAPLNMLEIGNASGSEAAIEDLEYSGIWLDYLPNADLYRADVVDLSHLGEDRFHPVVCDMNRRDAIATMAEGLPALDVVFDDGTHEAQPQQCAFVELWDKLKPGGFYIIENLRSQPTGVDLGGFPTSAELFYTFQKRKNFRHGDKAMKERLGEISPEISGCFLFQAGYHVERPHQVAVIHKR